MYSILSYFSAKCNDRFHPDRFPLRRSILPPNGLNPTFAVDSGTDSGNVFKSEIPKKQRKNIFVKKLFPVRGRAKKPFLKPKALMLI